MEWKLGATESFSQFGKDGWTKRDMQIKFTPNSTVGNKLITFLQTRLQLEQGGTPSNKPEIDIRADIYEFEPFYGMNWDPKQKRWVPESLKTPTPPGFKNQPSSLADPAAYLYDPPWAPPGQTKRFESVPVVPETAERLGALTWGLDSDRVECTNEPSASFDEAVKKFYTVPTVIGPDPARKEHYDVILDGFERNVTTLTTNQEKKLDPIAPLVKNAPNLIVMVGGSGDDSDIYPEGASEKRAQAVADYLKSKAVPEKNLTVIGYGATWGLYPPTSKEGKEGLNRRVQISLSY